MEGGKTADTFVPAYFPDLAPSSFSSFLLKVWKGLRRQEDSYFFFSRNERKKTDRHISPQDFLFFSFYLQEMSISIFPIRRRGKRKKRLPCFCFARNKWLKSLLLVQVPRVRTTWIRSGARKSSARYAAGISYFLFSFFLWRGLDFVCCLIFSEFNLEPRLRNFGFSFFLERAFPLLLSWR